MSINELEYSHSASRWEAGSGADIRINKCMSECINECKFEWVHTHSASARRAARAANLHRFWIQLCKDFCVYAYLRLWERWCDICTGRGGKACGTMQYPWQVFQFRVSASLHGNSNGSSSKFSIRVSNSFERVLSIWSNVRSVSRRRACWAWTAQPYSMSSENAKILLVYSFIVYTELARTAQLTVLFTLDAASMNTKARGPQRSIDNIPRQLHCGLSPQYGT